MKKLLVLLLLVVSVVVAQAEVFSIRGLFWGDSKADVIDAEGEDYFDYSMDGTVIAYWRDDFDTITTVTYYFLNHKLIAVAYYLIDDHFSRLKHALESKYGEPTEFIYGVAGWVMPDQNTAIYLGQGVGETSLGYFALDVLRKIQNARDKTDREIL